MGEEGFRIRAAITKREGASDTAEREETGQEGAYVEKCGQRRSTK